MFGIGELVVLPLTLVLLVAPLALAIWLLVTINRMAKDVERVARAVGYLADRAARQDGITG